MMPSLTDAEVRILARVQRQVLRLLLICIPVLLVMMLPIPDPIGGILAVASLPVLLLIGIVGAVLTYRLARAVKNPVPWLYVIAAFFPYINTLTLLILNARATALLKRNGIAVGLLGARAGDGPA